MAQNPNYIPSQDGNFNQQPYQVPVSQDEMYAHLIQEERVKNIISQVSPDNQLYEIEMRVKGYRKNFMSGQWEKIDPNMPDPHPLLVGRYISYLSSILNQNTSMSNLSENQVNMLMKLVIEYLSDDMDCNSELYGLGSDYTERTRIGHIILNCTFMVLNRALNGQEAKRMWGSLSMSENNAMMGQKKQGAFDFLKFWK